MQARRLDLSLNRTEKTAIQNLEMLFSGFPVHHRRTMKLKLEEFSKFEVKEESPQQLNATETVLGCLNPFSQFVVKEIMTKSDSFEKVWELDESIF